MKKILTLNTQIELVDKTMFNTMTLENQMELVGKTIKEDIKSPKKSKKNKRSYYRHEYTRVRNDKVQHIKSCFVGGREEYDKRHTISPRQYYNEQTDSKGTFTTYYHWTGGKYKFYKDVQFIYNEFYSQHKYKLCVVPFWGGGSDFFNISPKIIGKIDTMVLNDIVPTLTGLLKNTLHRSEELKQSVLNILELKPDEELELKGYFKLLQDECRKFELNKDYENIELSAMFLILQNNSLNGIYNWDYINNYSEFTTTTMKKNNDLNITKKIDYTLWYFSQYKNIIIETMDYKELIEKYGSTETLIISDPPYVSQKFEEDDEKIKRTVISYGNDSFPHQECLEVFSQKLNDSSLIYHNYYNVDLIKEFVKCGFSYFDKHKKNISSNKDGTKKDCVELMVYQDKRLTKKREDKQKIINNTEYRPNIEFEKVS